VPQTDSSLLDEWESLRNPTDETAPGAAGRRDAATGDRQQARVPVLVRNAMFRRVELACPAALGPAHRDGPGIDWEAGRWPPTSPSTTPPARSRSDTGPDARGPHLLQVSEEPGAWLVRQVLDDPAGDHDWGISARVDLAASDAEGSAVLTVTGVDQL
jgi:hypothetical protein